MNWQNIEKYIGFLIAAIIVFYLALTANAYYQDKDLNLLLIKLQIIAAVAVVMVLSLFFYRHEKKVNPTLESRAYRFDASIIELIGLLFKKKECPYCNSKLRLIKKKTYEGKDRIEYTSGSAYGNIYKITFIYECDNCHKQIKLTELGKKVK